MNTIWSSRWCPSGAPVIKRLFLLFSILLSSAAPAGWVTASIDTLTHTRARKWTTMQSIAVDALGTLHAAWTESQSSTLKRVIYARKPAGGRWSTPETIAETTSNHVAIAVEESTGRPHIAFVYQFADTNDLCYATNRDGFWLCTRVTKDSIYDVTPSIALEQDSIPHIAWVSREPGVAFRVAYATNRTGVWTTQLLRGSQLGDFGLGAAPFLAISPQGRAHISYRGGNYGNYHIHHAQNSQPNDTVWAYEITYTDNDQCVVSGIAARDSEELFLVCSGNEYWGAPYHTYYLHRPAGSSAWNPCTLITGSASACMEGFCMNGTSVHATWQQINGNILMEMLYHVTNASGHWFNSPIRADSHTTRGAIVVDSSHCGHTLVIIETPADTELYCINSAPLVAVVESLSSAHPQLVVSTFIRNRLRIEVPPHYCDETVTIYASNGGIVRTLPVRNRLLLWDTRDQNGRPVPSGAYTLRCGNLLGRTVIIR